LCRKSIANYKQIIYVAHGGFLVRGSEKTNYVSAQKSELERSPKSATSHHFSLKIIQQEILQNTYEKKTKKKTTKNKAKKKHKHKREQSKH